LRLQFDLARDINGAARDVQSAIAAAAGQLPPNLPSLPTYRKVNPADAPIMIMALTSRTVDKGRMYDIASTVLQQKIAQLEGVGQIFVGGSSLPAVRVDLNPMALARYGIGLDEVRRVLAAANVNRPKGQLDDGRYTWEINATDQLRRAPEYEPLIVAWRNGAPVRLIDVARVESAVEDLRAGAVSNGETAVVLVINRQPGVNIIDTVDRIRAELPYLRALVPAEVTLRPVLDQTVTIRASVKNVEEALIISIALVVLVVFLFLRNVRATIIPGIVVPVSLIGTFAIMYLVGYSIDNLSLMALTVATGFVVDDAIVVVENVMRHIERGAGVLEATLTGAKEIGFTVLSMSISLVAVFIPILLMGGIVGRLFREFAVVLSVAVLVSLAISLTTTPMMCALLLRPHDPHHRPRLAVLGERIFDAITRAYGRTLTGRAPPPRDRDDHLPLDVRGERAPVQHRAEGVLPQQDNGRLAANIVAQQDVSFATIQEKMVRYAEHPEGRSGHRHGDLVHRRRRRARHHRQHRPRLHLAQVARRAQDLGRRGHHAPASQARAGARSHTLPAGRAGRAPGRALEQRAVPVHLAERRPRALERVGAAPATRDARDARAPRREQRSAEPRAGSPGGHRPRHRLASGREHADDRRHALRRLRAAPGVDHL
jgi:multidrug efflux pump